MVLHFKEALCRSRQWYEELGKLEDEQEGGQGQQKQESDCKPINSQW